MLFPDIELGQFKSSKVKGHGAIRKLIGDFLSYLHRV